MKFPHLIPLTLVLVGCSSPGTRRTDAIPAGQAVEPAQVSADQQARASVAVTTSAEVPVPVSTPFDYFADKRDEYLEGYREGYLSGMPRFLNPYARVGAASPRSVGWHDGVFAARLAEVMRTKME